MQIHFNDGYNLLLHMKFLIWSVDNNDNRNRAFWKLFYRIFAWLQFQNYSKLKFIFESIDGIHLLHRKMCWCWYAFVWLLFRFLFNFAIKNHIFLWLKRLALIDHGTFCTCFLFVCSFFFLLLPMPDNNKMLWINF